MNIQQMKKFTVLIVDDNEFALKAEAALFEHQNCCVIKATDANSALQILNENINLVITDIEMPNIQGDQLAYLIHKRFPTLPIIAVTGAQLNKINFNYKDSINQILQKPLTLEDCRRLIKSDCNHYAKVQAA